MTSDVKWFGKTYNSNQKGICQCPVLPEGSMRPLLSVCWTRMKRDVCVLLYSFHNCYSFSSPWRCFIQCPWSLRICGSCPIQGPTSHWMGRSQGQRQVSYICSPSFEGTRKGVAVGRWVWFQVKRIKWHKPFYVINVEVKRKETSIHIFNMSFEGTRKGVGVQHSWRCM